jgi:hypothetical protein
MSRNIDMTPSATYIVRIEESTAPRAMAIEDFLGEAVGKEINAFEIVSRPTGAKVASNQDLIDTLRNRIENNTADLRATQPAQWFPLAELKRRRDFLRGMIYAYRLCTNCIADSYGMEDNVDNAYKFAQRTFKEAQA